jgi:isopentenyldiphosphate isomerase
VDPGDELVDIVDEEDRETGVVTRREMRARRLRHRCTYVLVRDGRGRLYVHRRTEGKDVFPGMYDATVGGVVLHGESYDEGARRELEEELGIRGADLRFLWKLRYDGEDGPAWGAVYEATWEGPVRPQESEIAWGAFLPLEEVRRMARELPFCPDGLLVLERWLGERAPTAGQGAGRGRTWPPPGPS